MIHYKVFENDGKKSRAVFMETKAITRAVRKNGGVIMERLEQDFYMICYDCLYYGYFKGFIFENYKDIIESLGVEKATTIYNRAFNKITSE